MGALGTERDIWLLIKKKWIFKAIESSPDEKKTKQKW